MDIKQFNLFQETVQYAIDEDKRQRETGLKSHFDMSSWFTFGYESQRRGVKFTPLLDVPGYETYSKVEGATLGSCGTAACLAGTAVLLNGSDVPIVDTTDISETDGAAWVLTEDRRAMSISQRAQDLLGLTSGEASRLFHMTNASIESIVVYCRELAKRYDHELEVMW